MTNGPALSQSAAAMGASVFADLLPRIEARTRAGGDLVALHIGDTHVAPPPAARFGGVEPGGYDPALYRYGEIPGLAELRSAFAGALGRAGRGPADVDPARHVLLGAGATHGIACGLRAVLEAGDEVLVVAPYWPLAVGIVRTVGAIPVEVPLTDRLYADPSLDPAAVLAEALTPRTRALYFISPNNPDGYVYDDAQLASLAAFARQHDLWVLSDEVYADTCYDRPHRSIARLEGMAERTMSAYSLSKSHALAGARVGFLVGPERVISLARRVATHTVFNVPVAAQRVAIEALAAGDGWLGEVRDAHRHARQVALDELKGLQAPLVAPHGGSYLFVDFGAVLRGRPMRELLERAVDRGVLVAPGDGCGKAYGRWARICFTSVDEARLRTGLARLHEAVRAFVA